MQVMGLNGYGLSSQQARVWSLQAPGQTYNILCVLLLRGKLHQGLLETLLLRIINRHEILRTTFHFPPGMDIPVQIINECSTYACTFIDMINVDNHRITEFMSSLQEETWDLERSPLLRTWLVRQSSDEHILFIGMPALCADIHTLNLLVAELIQAYNTYPEEEEQDEDPLQYADVSAWQDELLREDSAKFEQQYWDRIDFSSLATQPLPFEREGNTANWSFTKRSKAVFVPQVLDISLDDVFTMQLQSLSQKQNIALSTCLLTCWSMLFWRLCHEEQFVIGVACNGRVFAEIEGALGNYTRFMPVEARFDGDVSFEQFLSLMQSSVEEAVKRQIHFSWDALGLAEEKVFFPLCFEYNSWTATHTGGALSATLSQLSGYTEPFALKLSALTQGERLHLHLQYDETRIQRPHVARIASALQTLLQSAVAHPTQSMGMLRLLPLVEQENLLRTFCPPQTPIASESLAHLFERQVERTPDLLAVLSAADQLTYYDLNCRANQVAHTLQRLGVGANTAVGLYMNRSVDMIIGLLAILKAGGAYVPLDPEHPATRLEYQLRDLQISLLLTQEALLTRLPAWEGHTLCIDAKGESIEQESTANLPVIHDRLDLAYVIYTSGSTGKPKGVVIQQRSVLNYTQSLCKLVAREPGLHFALTTTLAADLGNTVIFCALASGGCIQVLDYETITSGEAFARWVKEHPIDVLKIVPSHLSALLAGEHAQAQLPRQALILGGEIFPGKLLARLRELGATCKILNHYGPTESTIGVLVNVLESLGVDEGGGKETDAERTAVPLGKPIANSEVYLLDSRLQVVPVGVTGELYIGGAGLAIGYWQLPEQTAERFLPHPFATLPGSRVYRTGDLARYTSQGLIEFVGRRDNQVKIRGYRIELAEIEAIVRQHRNVRDVVVIARKDALGEIRLVCYIVARNQPLPTTEELRSYIRGYLPEYMVPSVYMLLDALPLTINGKVDLQGLPAAEQHQKAILVTGNEPRSPIEEILCDIWQDLLSLAVVDVHDNFFQLGGHSLLATQLVSQVRTMLKVELSILSIFEAPTIAQFARRVVQALSNEQALEAPPLVSVERIQKLPLSFAQQRLWFLDQLEPGDVAYLTPRALRLSGDLNVKALGMSLQEVVRRHENLRTTFYEQGGQPLQIIHGMEMFHLPCVDLRELSVADRDHETYRLAEEESRRPCDLANGPLFRTFLVFLDAKEQILLVTMHHIITDGWSNTIWMRELSLLYNAFVQRLPSPLSPLPIQYADFAVWQRQWLQSQAFDTQLHYWTNQLSNIVPLDLPTDHPRPTLQTSRGAYQSTTLSSELHKQLRLLSQREGVTLFMTLLAAFQVLLARYTGQEDIAVGTPIANRTHRELEGLIGFFVNTLVMRTDLSANPRFREILMRVRQVALDAYAHQDVPFEKVVELVQPERDLSRSPLFQVMLILQNAPPSLGELEGVTISQMSQLNATAKFDLTMFIEKDEQGLLCTVEYNTDLFEHATISRLLGHWCTLLEAVVAQPDQRLADLPLLTSAESLQLLTSPHVKTLPLSSQSLVHSSIEEQVRRTPDAIALSCGDDMLTYEQLNQQANKLASLLRRHGVRPEVPVGLFMQRSLSAIVALLAIFKADGVFLPLDPLLPTDRLRHALRQCACPVLLFDVPSQPRLTLMLEGLDERERPAHVWEMESLYLSGGECTDMPSSLLPTNLAYIIYTSGSTGVPKGVMVEQQGMFNHMWAKIDDVGLGATDCVAQNGPQSFDIVVWQCLAALMRGGRVHIIKDEQALLATSLREELERGGVTLLQLVPVMLRELLTDVEEREKEGRAGNEFARLRWIIPTGDALPGDLCRRWVSRYPHMRLLNTYGATECSDDQYHYEWLGERDEGQEQPIVSLGYPIVNMSGYVLDRWGQQVPIGVVGELYLAGVGVGRGYVQDAAKTAEVFVPDGYSGQVGGRMYRMKDLVRRDSLGRLEFLGRSDHLVKIGGYRIELGEIEAALAEHEGVQESVVVGRAEEGREKTLIGYVVGKEKKSLNEQELRRYLQGKLPEYMVPVRIVQLESLPLNANGKIDRRALPVPEQGVEEEEIGASGNQLEEMIGSIWNEMLGKERVGRQENFFALGGHSLLATRLVARVRTLLGVDLPLKALFEAPTVAKLTRQVARILQGGQGIDMPPLLSVTREQPLPLSFAQQRLWFLEQLEPGNTAYLIPIVLRLQGQLDQRALERSLQELVQRHESLRTTFTEQTGQPVQVIEPWVPLVLPVVELGALEVQERERQVQQMVTQERRQPCDMVRGPLLRVRLLRLTEHEYVLLITMHHIISDAWSSEVFFPELATFYRAFVQDQPSPLPALPIQYADFAVWQRQWLQGAVLDQQVAYWREQLAGVQPLALPTDHPHPPLKTYHGAQYLFQLPASLQEALEALGRREQVTQFMLLLAAFQVLLARYSGQEDIAVGTPIANRTHKEVEGLIGFFVNTLVMRTQVRGAHSFVQLLRQVREMAVGAYTHQDVPFEHLVEILSPERSVSQTPLFQVMFALRNTSSLQVELPGLNWQPLESEYQTAKFDLAMYLSEDTDGIRGQVEYNTDLFEEATIVRLSQHWQLLLQEIVAHAELPLGEFRFLSEAEWQQQLITWNATQRTYPHERCVHELFEEQVERTPDVIALVDAQHQITYRKLDTLANQLAQYLERLGVCPDAIVGVCMERSIGMVLSQLSILKAGGAYLPLDPTYPPQRLASLLTDAHVGIVLTQERWLAVITDIAPVHLFCLDRDWHQTTSCPLTPPDSYVHPDNLAYVIYTSGSTGQPKGVQISHRNLLNLVTWHLRTYDVQAHDRSTQIASLAFDACVWEIWPTLAGGASLVFSDEETRLSPPRLRDWLLTEQITHCFIPTPLTEKLLHLPWPPQTPLRFLLTGGDTLHHAPDLLLPFQLINHYGPTESTVVATAGAVDQQERKRRPSIGRPIANTSVYVLDAHLQPVPVGVIGELYLAGASLSRGYLHRPDLTAEKFLAHPFSRDPGARFYRTGDLVRYLPDGQIEFVGRRDEQVKLRGYRIELGEIEAVLRQHAAVEDGIVQVRDDTGEKLLVAYTVYKAACEVSAQELIYYMRERLPEYMVPMAYVMLAQWPLTANGKVDRHALPSPERSRVAGERALIEPRVPLEQLLTDVWRDVLNVEPIGIHENFFELGGHSLLATQVISWTRKALQLELPLRALFEAPTIAELARRIEQEQRMTEGYLLPALNAVPRTLALPLSFAQQRLWFLDQLDPNDPTYNIPTALHLSGRFNVEAWEWSIEELVRRHEVLRTLFAHGETGPVQVIVPHLSLPVSVLDIQGLQQQERETEMQRLLQEEGEYPFNLARGPLLRASLVRLAAEEHVLLLTMHHIISDGWSSEIFSRELTTLYEAFVQGKPSPLPALPIQYADFAIWQRQWLQGAVLDQQVAYWREQLAGVQPLALPTDHPRPPVQTHRGASLGLLVPSTLLQQLHALSQREYVTLFMLLLAAFQVLLARSSGQHDIAVGTPIANRTHKEVEGLIGFFVNTLVMRSHLSRTLTFKQLLGQVREMALGAYAHQDVPFEHLVEALQPERDLSRSPLFQVLFTLEQPTQPAPSRAGFPASEPLQQTAVVRETTTAKFDLTWNVSSGPQGLWCAVTYNTDLFEPATIQRLLEHWQLLLQAIVADENQLVAHLPVLTDAEIQQQVVQWNDTGRVLPPFEDLSQAIEAQVARTPDAIALVFEQTCLSYQSLNERAGRLARHLHTAGVGPEVLVGVFMDRSLDLSIALLAILHAGGAYVPLDVTAPQGRLRWMLKDAAPRLVLTQRHLRDRVVQATEVDLWCVDEMEDWQEAPESFSRVVAPENLAYVIYTSGSTGNPKGAMNTQQGILNRLWWMQEAYGLQPSDVVLQKTPVSFDVSVWELFWPLLVGARLVLARPEGHRESAYLVEVIEQEQICVLHFVPSMLQVFLEEEGLERCAGIRVVICSGEALTVALQERCFARLPAQLHNLYGPTEAAVDVTFWACERGVLRQTVPLGRPISNIELYILDEAMEVVPRGVAGELYIAGRGVARGYVGRADLTAERFVPHPWVRQGTGVKGERLYRTGDRARYQEGGVIEYLGRGDQQVKLRGNRIELGEIEAVLEQHPEVRESVVMLREEESELKGLVAYVVRQGGGDVEEGSLRRYVQQYLPDYMVPSLFVVLPVLPLLPNGKLDRKALPTPDYQSLSNNNAFVAPQTRLQKRLADIWAELLHRSQIGIHDNFFALGGHSLLATLLMMHIRTTFEVNIPLRSLFEAPTIAEMSTHIEQVQIEQVQEKLGEQAEDDEIEQMLAALERLADDEVYFISNDQI